MGPLLTGRKDARLEETLCAKQKQSERSRLFMWGWWTRGDPVEYLIVVSLLLSVSGGSVHARWCGRHAAIDPDYRCMDELQEAKAKAGQRRTAEQ